MEPNTEEQPKTQTEKAREFAAILRKGWTEMVLEKRKKGGKPSAHNYVYAGAWRACERRMVYEMTIPDQQPSFEADLLAKFERANDRERELLIDLQRVGRLVEPEFQVVGQQERFVLRGRDGAEVIVGKVDARIKCRELSMTAPLEIKAWHPNLVARVSRFEDLLTNTWTRSGAYQLLAYMFGANEPLGFMLLDRPGLPQPLPVALEDHLETMEAFLRKAERAVAHRKANTLPDFHDEPDECKRCPFFGGACQPPLDFKGATLFTDPEFIAILERREELKDAAKLFEALDKSAKAALRGVPEAIAGPYYIKGKYTTLTTYPLTDDQKAKFKVSDPKGKFQVTITRLTPKEPTNQTTTVEKDELE